jgi:quaternary ammonium compound-resistance protein SugE
MKLLLLSLAALLFAFGGLAMKYSQGMTRVWPSVVFLLLFVFGASCQALAMRSAEMGPAYVFVLGVEAVAAMALSIAVLGERLTVARAVAVILIVGGITILHR